MNILVTTSSFSIKDFAPGINVVFNPYGRKLSEDEVRGLVEEYDPVGIIAGVEPLTGKVFSAAKSLRVVSRCGIGMDSVDMGAAAGRGIRVVNTPDAPTQAVAELTVGLMLSVLRRIPQLDSAVRNGSWKGPKGFLLSGRTVGIIGCGRIGTRVGEICSAFGCTVIGFDRFLASHASIRLTDLDELLESSDIISLHIPYSEENRNIISKESLGLMKKSAVLINASRGGLVDEEALYTALSENMIAGAALDCFVSEPYEGKLAGLENVVLSPHMGSSTVETRGIMEKQAADNLMGILAEMKLI